MIEKLKVYRDELIAKGETLKNTDHSAEIDAKVLAYRDQLIAEAKAELDRELKKIDSDVECLNKIIEKEEAIAEAAVIESEAAPVDVNIG